MLEIWRAGGTTTGGSAELAQAIEAQGWDGQMFMDSQSLSADPYVQMGVWAASTSRIKLSPGVTNPTTRNLAVTANGAVTVQAVSGGRAVLGIGRGDSALAYLGFAPARLGRFERDLRNLQTLLRGEEVPFDHLGEHVDEPSLEELPLGARPTGVKLKWLPDGFAKVPLDVAATGPKVIAMAARIAERVTFSIGADVERVDWALGIARAASAEAVSYGAQVIVVCHPDDGAALEVAMSMAPALARFQVMQGEAAGPRGSDDSSSYDAIRSGYDMTKHGSAYERNRLTHGRLTSGFVRRFAIVGSPDHCTERLLKLRKAGLERFVIVGPGFYPPEWGDAASLFTREVIPALRAS
ncbi:LLM class F420-dependent oxidoreductase [Novosphingobium endophyticum]|uniref:LLM class F420-dependent oxidoreductase n=1 Tax=Novosphingobium endophyticum TaxID=1955250 RepID=A0A916TT14_9SPHN|nr:LLM class flavin-dependent oxidoreductase [Novosphingobium endophyticum]GGC04829.1 LLM class F420-dependent oxidoreductase [Novosphingobium endophyticum]